MSSHMHNLTPISVHTTTTSNTKPTRPTTTKAILHNLPRSRIMHRIRRMQPRPRITSNSLPRRANILLIRHIQRARLPLRLCLCAHARRVRHAFHSFEGARLVEHGNEEAVCVEDVGVGGCVVGEERGEEGVQAGVEGGDGGYEVELARGVPGGGDVDHGAVEGGRGEEEEVACACVEEL